MINMLAMLVKATVCVLFLSLVLAGCAFFKKEQISEEEIGVSDVRISNDFYRVALDVGPNYVWLKNGSCRLFVGIDEGQARSIFEGLKGMHGKRPNTHDLVADLLTKLNITVNGIKIIKMEGGIYFAVIDVGNAEIDSRPSDAIAIAVRVGAPIFVSKEIMHKYGECVVEDTKGLSSAEKSYEFEFEL